MVSDMGAAPDPNIVRLGKAMLARADDVAGAVADVIRRDVGFYHSHPGVVANDELRRSCLANMTYVYDALAGYVDADVTVAEDTGVRRALAGVPLATVMAGDSGGVSLLW